MNITEQELADIYRRMGTPVPISGADRPKPEKPAMNKTETRFAQWLELQHKASAISSWMFEAWTFKIGPDCRYTPDFVIRHNDGSFTLVDVKGRTSKNGKDTYRAEDDSLVKIRVSAAMFPWFRWVICFPEKSGEWREVAF